MTPHDKLIDLYKYQFEWSVTHRHSIYQRMATLLAVLGIIVGLLGVLLTSNSRPAFTPPFALLLQIGTGLLMSAGFLFMLFVLQSQRTGLERFLAIEVWLLRNPGHTTAQLQNVLADNFRQLLLRNLRLTRLTRESYNIALMILFVGIALIGISLSFSISLSKTG